MGNEHTCRLLEKASCMSAETYLRIEASSSRIPVFVLEQELIHDEHSQGNELPLSHIGTATSVRNQRQVCKR